jgi:apolipoprotein N-acyltransferase
MFRDTLYTFDPDARAPKEWGGSEEEFQRRLRQVAEDSRVEMAWLANHLGVPLVLGVDTYRFTAAGKQRFNSAVLVSRRGEILNRYDKMHLVLFGEYVPFAKTFPWLYRFTPLAGGLTAGTRPAAFDAAGLRIAPNICYETILPHVIRRQVNDLDRQGRRVDVLMNLTNDGWYWGSSELDMHLICGVFRAVECRKPLLIAANTGFSAWIDADGRLRAVGPRRDTDIILAQVHPDERTSWYLAHGDIPAGVCLAVCLIFAAVACRDRLHGWLGSSEASPQEHRVAGA